MITTEKNRRFQLTHGLVWITIVILGLVSCQSQKAIGEYQQEKAETAYSEFTANLAKAESVEFLDGNW